MSYQAPETDQATPTIPPRWRTIAYVVGVLAGLVVAPSLAAAGLLVPAAIAGAVSGGANALAFGYRPTRGHG